MTTDDKNHSHTFEEELSTKDFRVAIFGSARIKPNDACYKMTFDLAKMIGAAGHDIVTGGGPGIMEAANYGHKAGADPSSFDAHSIGLTVNLPHETEENKHLDLKKHFAKFSNRLDHFMVLSNIVVVMPGGVGTCLEFFYTWQLTQVKHICSMPILLLGDMWEDLVRWITDGPLKEGYISPEDMHNIIVAKDNEHAMEIIHKAHEIFEKEGDNYCMNFKKYKLT